MVRELAGFRFDNAQTKWVLEDRITKVKTLKQLLDEFYTEHSDSEPPYKPLGWIRDPEQEGRRIYGDTTTVIMAPYRRGYYIVIEKQFQLIQGPHAARLYWKHPDGGVVWVAIMQLQCMFYSDERMQSLLLTLLESREFYQSDKTAAIVIQY